VKYSRRALQRHHKREVLMRALKRMDAILQGFKANAKKRVAGYWGTLGIDFHAT
jgi:hypothetical protein